MLRNQLGAGIFAAVFLAFALSGCGPTSYQLEPTNLTPSSTGEVEVETDDNANTKVDLEVKHMAPPRNLDQSLSTYVVWIDSPTETNMIKAGQLQVDDNRNGELEFTTPHSTFELVVTAEATSEVRTPSEYVVLRQMIEAN